MPYKDKEEQRKSVREAVAKHRQGITGQGITGQGITMVPASYVQGLNGRKYRSLPERPRFVTLSDGQVLDRLNQPIADKTKIPQMRASNECYNFHPAEGKLTKELKAKLS